jgi:hypothetical protein
MCIPIYIHIHVHTFTHKYTQTYMHIHTHIHAHGHIYLHEYTLTYIHWHTFIHTYTNRHTYTHTYIRTHINTPIHHTHTYVHTHTHTHIHKQVRAQFCISSRYHCNGYLQKLFHARFSLVVYIRKDDSTDLVWDSFVKPFSLGVWVSLIGCLLTFSVAFLLLDRVWPQHRRQEGLLLEFPRALFSVIRPFCWQGGVVIWNMDLNGDWRKPPPIAMAFWFNSHCRDSSPQDLGIIPLHLRAKLHISCAAKWFMGFGNLAVVIP